MNSVYTRGENNSYVQTAINKLMNMVIALLGVSLLCVMSTIDQYAITCMDTSTIRPYTQLSPLYLLSTLYVAHMINYSRPSTAFSH